MIDLDRFKKVNDRLGHERGDTVLEAVARGLRDVVGDAGPVSRWGGEEFLVLFPGADLTMTASVIERAREAIAAPEVTAISQGPITMSVGMAQAAAGIPWQVAVRVADALMYDAESAGRDAVRSAQVRPDPATETR